MNLRFLRWPQSWQLSRRSSSRLAASTDVVVCGGGLAGTSVALALARRGKRVYLIEKNAVGTSGATGMCAGLITAPAFWKHPSCQFLAERSLRLYEELADSKGFDYLKCGRVYLASSERSELFLERMLTRGKRTGGIEKIKCPKELATLLPIANLNGVQMAVLSTEDVVVDTASLCQEMAAEAVLAGARVLEGVEVAEVLLGHEKQVYAVETTDGLIEAPIFVDAAGTMSRHIETKTLLAGRVRQASHAAVYQYLVAPRLPSSTVLSNQIPIINDMEANWVMHAGSRRTLFAGFREESIRVVGRGEDVRSTETTPDWDRFEGVLGDALSRITTLGSVTGGDLMAGLEAFSPDGACIAGQTSQARGYYMIGGFSGQGLSLAGGVGEVLADWICTSSPSVDVSTIDVARFLDLHANSQYLLERAPEVASLTYRNPSSSYQFHSARNLRTSPIYQQLREAGAVFGETMGYERPLWFEPKGPESSLYYGVHSSLGTPPWFAHVAGEYRACRERVGLIDMSSFSKFEISGPESVRLLQFLCSADIDRPIGSTIYTGMQNEKGGYVSDCTLSRLGDHSWFMVAPTIQQERLALWIRSWAQKLKMNIELHDVTSAFTALDVVGPLSRNLLADLTSFPVSASEFPAFRCHEVNIGMATGIRAISVTHCGELGWVLYIPNEQAQNVYERIVETGREYSLEHAGYFTLRHLRIEKFYVYWGQDIDATVTPVECGRAFRVDLDKDFIGREAIRRQMEEGVQKRFVHVLVEHHDKEKDPWADGGEAILRDGRVVGHTTSAAYAFTLGCQVCIAVVHNEEGVTLPFLSSGSWEMEIAGRRFSVRISPHSPSLPMESSEHPSHYRPTR